MKTRNSEFLEVVYGQLKEGTHGWVCTFRSDPAAADASVWGGRAYKGFPAQSVLIDRVQDDNAYFCTAVLSASDTGQVARVKSAFHRLAVLLADDVNLSEMNGTPTYVIETSPGKHQAGIVIEPEDEDAHDAQLVDAVMRELSKEGRSNDTSGNSRVRYGRLPNGSNTKSRSTGAFRVRMQQWNPEHILSLADACAVLGVDIDALKSQQAQGAIKAEYKPDPAVRSVDGVAEGGRDESVYKYACSLRARDVDMDEARVLVLHKAATCLPPFPESQALKCLESAWQHPAGKSAEFREPAKELTVSDRPLFVGADELIASAKSPEWVIKGYLEENTLALMFGDPEAGKSFISISMACSIATGHEWMGHEIKRTGPVFYICGEGYNGIARRLKAWSIRNRTPLDRGLFLSERPVSISDAQSVAALLDEIDSLAAIHGSPVAVFVDTVARNFGEGDENSTKDMTRFVAGLDAIKSKYRCTIVAVHHSGHADKARARGSIVLKGALDAEYKVSKVAGDEIRQIEATKMKDGPKPAPLNFRILGIPLPGVVDEEGEISTGGCAEPVQDFSKLLKPKGKNQAQMLEVLLNLYDKHRANLKAGNFDPDEARVKIEDWRQATNVPRNRWSESLTALQSSGHVRLESGGYAIPTVKQASEASELQV